VFGRIFGPEQEYTVIFSKEGRAFAVPAGNVLSSTAQWRCRNGGRLYPDYGEHLEYAGPECRSGRQVKLYTLAGHALIAQKVEAYLRMANHGVTDPAQMLKAVICADNGNELSTQGTHENYLYVRMPFDRGLERYARPFLLYMATSILVLGSGGYGIGRQRFVLSHRASHLYTPISTSTTSKRGFINTRDEPHLSEKQNETYGRLHVIGGNAQIFPDLIGLKFAVMSVLMSMREAGKLATLGMSDADLVRVHQGVNLDPDYRFNAGGRQMTALTTQKFYFDQAWNFAQDTPELARHLPELTLWGQILEELTETLEFEAHVRRLDWAAKRRYVERWLARKESQRLFAADPARWARRLRTLEQYCHQVNDPNSIYWRIVNDSGQYDAEAVTEAMAVPPPDTRANIRGFAAGLEALNGLGWSQRTHVTGWNSVTIGGTVFPLEDPFAHEITDKMLAASKRA
jgi:proteasome accessory factor A